MKFDFKKSSQKTLSFWNRARDFMLLWGTQALSALGSSMTSFALIIWAYRQQDSAMTTAMLSVCSYAPYVLTSLFAGALSDRWNKKTVMLVCDSLAALSTVAVLILLNTGRLEIWHLYALNALNGLYPKDAVRQALAACGLPETVRGERLSLEQFAALTLRLT